MGPDHCNILLAYLLCFSRLIIFSLSFLFVAFDYPTDTNYLSQIKYESAHEFKISQDTLIDARLTKMIMDNIIESSSKYSLDGFVQNIMTDPFGYLLVTQMQVMLENRDSLHI